jgi:hypothetical protein
VEPLDACGMNRTKRSTRNGGSKGGAGHARVWVATRTISDDMHKSAFLRMEETDAWAERSPAFRYHGNKLIWSHLEEGSAVLLSP